ncbi:LPXTG cell wall anchor domain-containing protein [uncultured Vagococcus sp.]|uniref:LPXTG cell wall anchor domain-containing protein n=1 Tax=uncultured Vagococcus sp. TaxID=189676 RepID=UPI0028D5111F|nr:LPXTG cell wall anchor domain-containing protein [uncultured Vagococcus sp.]
MTLEGVGALVKKVASLVVLMAWLLLFGFSNRSFAESLPSGFLIGDDGGFTAKSDGKYFIEYNQVEPGATFAKEIIMSNYSQEDGPLTVKLIMNQDNKDYVPKSVGKVNLLRAIDVRLTLDGKVIYEGLMDGTGKDNKRNKNTPFVLGEYSTGKIGHLNADFKVRNDLPKEDWQEISEVDFYWVFYVNRDETKELPKTKPTGPWTKLPPGLAEKLPQTGEELAFVIIGMIIGLLIILLSLSVYKKRGLMRE